VLHSCVPQTFEEEPVFGPVGAIPSHHYYLTICAEPLYGISSARRRRRHQQQQQQRQRGCIGSSFTHASHAPTRRRDRAPGTDCKVSADNAACADHALGSTLPPTRDVTASWTNPALRKVVSKMMSTISAVDWTDAETANSHYKLVLCDTAASADNGSARLCDGEFDGSSFGYVTSSSTTLLPGPLSSPTLELVTHGDIWTPDVVQRVATLVPLMVASLLGNAITVVVLTCSKYRKLNSRINIFIINLAVGDLAVCCFTMTTEVSRLTTSFVCSWTCRVDRVGRRKRFLRTSWSQGEYRRPCIQTCTKELRVSRG
jgi:hypothetical protein